MTRWTKTATPPVTSTASRLVPFPRLSESPKFLEPWTVFPTPQISKARA